MLRMRIADRDVKFTRKGAFIDMGSETVLLPKWLCRDCMGNAVPDYRGGSPVVLGYGKLSAVYDSPVYYFAGGKKCGVCGRLKADLRLFGLLDKGNNLFYYHDHRRLRTKQLEEVPWKRG